MAPSATNHLDSQKQQIVCLFPTNPSDNGLSLSPSIAKPLKMPPKKGKDADAPKRVILGRSTNNLKMGIVGLPNVGKSSLFNTLSKLSVAAENFPFCTIDPNVAKVTGTWIGSPLVKRNNARVLSFDFPSVPDKRFRFLVEKYKPKSVVPAQLSITDIAGYVTWIIGTCFCVTVVCRLVKGASEGAGLGNAFLSHIAAVDGA